MKISLLRSLLALGLAVLLLAACQNSGSPTGENDEEVAALDYLRATLVNDADRLPNLICDNVPAGTATLDLLSYWYIGMALNASPDFDIDDLDIDVTAERLNTDGNVAEVRMRGSVTFPEDLPPSPQAPLPVDKRAPIDEVWVMVNEEGNWKWCGNATD